MKLFGFEIKKAIGAKEPKDELQSFAPPMDIDGSSVIMSGGAGYYGQVFDIDGTTINNERDLIIKYREASMHPECDSAISDIVNAAIISDDGNPLDINLDDVELSDGVKKKIRDEFSNVLKLLRFNMNGVDIFRRWYIDGRLYYHMMIDPEKPKNGIKELRMIDPLKIKKVKEIKHSIHKETGAKTSSIASEYFLYSDDFINATAGVKIDKSAVTYVPSGILDESGRIAVSYLHKCVRLVNNLQRMEASLVIYRIARAPERRIFYIDVGNLPKGKAEEYVQGIMSKYRNKLVYDATTGEVRDDRKSMSMLEDFWLPRREGGRGTEITTLPGGQSLGEIDDVLFFQKKLYSALNVPTGRLEQDNMFNVGRSTEISRQEVKFQKFINNLRNKFSQLFIDILRTQLILKSIITENDWPEIEEGMVVDYVEDNFFAELKDFEIMKERVAMLDALSAHVGKYYSEKWIKSNVLNQSEDDIEKMKGEMDEETPKDTGFPSAEGDSTDQEDQEGDTEDLEVKPPVAEKPKPAKKFPFGNK